jgi:hypothetical protein
LIVAMLRRVFGLPSPALNAEYRRMVEVREAERQIAHRQAERKNKQLYDRLSALRAETERARGETEE